MTLSRNTVQRSRNREGGFPRIGPFPPVLGGTPAGGPFLTDREHPEYKVLGQLNPPVRVFTIMRNRVHDGVLSVHDQRNTQEAMVVDWCERNAVKIK
ncbi:MAG: hypothetical protein ACYDEV_13680 [Acidiferrobacter sp.]